MTSQEFVIAARLQKTAPKAGALYVEVQGARANYPSLSATEVACIYATERNPAKRHQLLQALTGTTAAPAQPAAATKQLERSRLQPHRPEMLFDGFAAAMCGDSQMLRWVNFYERKDVSVKHGRQRTIGKFIQSGLTINGLLTKFRTNKIPPNLMIFVGVNDILKTAENYSATQAIQDIKNFHKELTSKNYVRNLVFVTLPPMPKFPYVHAANRAVREFNEAVQTLKDRKTSLFKTDTKFLKPAEEGQEQQISSFYFSKDGLHLNSAAFHLLDTKRKELWEH